MTDYDPELSTVLNKFSDCLSRVREQAGRLALDGPFASPVAVLDLDKERRQLRKQAREVETMCEKKGIPDTEGKLCKMAMEKTDPERIRIEMLNTFDAVERQTNLDGRSVLDIGPFPSPSLEQVLISPPAPSSTAALSHATPRPDAGASKAQLPVTTNSIKNAFPPPAGVEINNWHRTLSDCPKWLSHARMFNGGRGKSALWNPVIFASCMVTRKHIGKGKARTIIQREFPEWLDAWEEYLAYDD